MNIAILGYGKMGKTIERIALERGHKISLIIDINNQNELTKENLQKADVAIDFSTPTSAYFNIIKCFEANIPIVCGTTGWLEKFDEVAKLCIKEKKAFFYASNYSIGVNIFFAINKYLARIMNDFSDYQVDIEETHHTQKLDAPSGTAITLAENIIENLNRKNKWKLDCEGLDESLRVHAIREPDVPGIHKIKYENNIDFIEIKHSAKNRDGFALGAVLAAEYIKGKTGVFSMNDLLKMP